MTADEALTCLRSVCATLSPDQRKSALRALDVLGPNTLLAENRNLKAEIQRLCDALGEILDRTKEDHTHAIALSTLQPHMVQPHLIRIGIYEKYRIAKADGSPLDPRAVYFVLRLDTDPAARVAALAYAKTTDNEDLSEDLRQLVASCTLAAETEDR